jgi:hypothetical protein
MTTRPGWGARVAVVAALLVAGACGSTAKQQAGQRLDPSSELGATSDGFGDAATDAAATGADAGATGGGVSRATATTARRGGIAAGRKPAGAQAGVSDTEIKIGVAIASDLEAVGAFGASLASQSTDKAERAVRVIFDSINANGGAAGRKLVPVFQEVAYVTGGDFDRQSQSMCEYFTQDNKVFAVAMGINNHSTLLPACLGSHDTVMLDGGNSTYLDEQEIRPFARTYYRPGGLAFAKWGVYIDGLVRQGLLKRGDKIGLLRYDIPQQARIVANVIRPALARHGLALGEEFAYSNLTSSAALGQNAAQSGNAVLRFRTAGINRVLFLASQSPIPFTFMAAAEQQGYRPRYGVTSADFPNFLATNVPPAQLAGAGGIGWTRSLDLPGQAWPDVASWARCMRVMRAAGFTEDVFGFGCDPFWFLQTALNRASVVSTAGFRAAVDGLADAITIGSGFATRFRPVEAMAVAGYRELSFDGACGCWAYSSPVRLVP